MNKQELITVKTDRRGFIDITKTINSTFPKLPHYGVINIFIKHTSAGICITENTDPDVLSDFDLYLEKLIDRNWPYYKHNNEVLDDMPAHIKSGLIGTSLTVPIVDGELDLGIWQGIFLAEFRDKGSTRTIRATVIS